MTNPAKAVSLAREKPSPVGILEPEELARLLERSRQETLPYWAIGAFAGLRSAELERLEWRDVHFDKGLVEVSAAKSKSAARRFVKMQPALTAWLEPYRNRTGQICPPGLRKLLLADRQRAGLSEWPPNALRHSFASYHLAQFSNAAELALELGHVSPHVVFRHYRELVRPESARSYWSIWPAHSTPSLAVA